MKQKYKHLNWMIAIISVFNLKNTNTEFNQKSFSLQNININERDIKIKKKYGVARYVCCK